MNFRIGQRVRILWSKHYPELAGQEGTVQSALIPCQNTLYGYMGYHVAPDAWGSMMCPYDQASMFAAKPEQLAPTYDGNTKVEWDTCAWRPDTEHA